MAWIAEQLLTAIRDDRLFDCITEERLTMLTGLKPRQIEGALQTLRHHDMVERSELGCHQLTSAGKAALAAGSASLRSGPKKGWGSEHTRKLQKTPLRELAWRAMCIRRKFTVAEIITLSVQGNERGDVTNNVQKYVRALAKAGYLVELPRREPCKSPTSPGFKRWWLPDNAYPGPKAPMVRRNYTAVYDPNTETEIVIKQVAK